jgi:hypothetical protein
VAPSSRPAGGVFSGFGVSSSFEADLESPTFLFFRETSVAGDFFFADFGFGVGVCRRFDFDDEAPRSGVLCGTGDPSSSLSDSFAAFALRGGGDSSVSGDSLWSLTDPSLEVFAFGVGDFFFVEDESVVFRDSSCASFACGIAVGGFSALPWAGCFFFDLSFDAIGLGDFFGFACAEAVVSEVSLLPLFSSSATCARRRLPTIAPEASAVASQMRKRTTATDRNRARGVINQIVKKVKRITNPERNYPFVLIFLIL